MNGSRDDLLLSDHLPRIPWTSWLATGGIIGSAYAHPCPNGERGLRTHSERYPLETY